MVAEKNILIPIDFNQQSFIALEQSYNLAKMLGFGLTLLYVHEDNNPLTDIFTEHQSKKVREMLQEKLDEIAAKTEGLVEIPIRTQVVKGRIHARIIDVAQKTQAPFIVMGASSEGVYEDEPRGMVGANTSRVLRMAKRPVITVNGHHHHDGCRSILLPLDLTKETKEKIAYATAIAKMFNAKIKVLSVHMQSKKKEVLDRLKKQLDEVVSIVKKENIEVSAELIEGTPSDKTLAPAIINYTNQQHDVDLVMIMTQQESRLVKYFIGSSAQEIIRNSKVPVMSIIPKELGFNDVFSR